MRRSRREMKPLVAMIEEIALVKRQIQRRPPSANTPWSIDIRRPRYCTQYLMRYPLASSSSAGTRCLPMSSLTKRFSMGITRCTVPMNLLELAQEVRVKESTVRTSQLMIDYLRSRLSNGAMSRCVWDARSTHLATLSRSSMSDRKVRTLGRLLKPLQQHITSLTPKVTFRKEKNRRPKMSASSSKKPVLAEASLHCSICKNLKRTRISSSWDARSKKP